LQRVARYVHLSPVRLIRLALGKKHRQAAAQGLSDAPRGELVRERIEVLRTYCWSSYGAVAGYRAAPDWLHIKLLQSVCGGKNRTDEC